jgi:hypothetical protein
MTWLETWREAGGHHACISDRDVDYLHRCRRRARHLADRRGAGGAQAQSEAARQSAPGTAQGGIHVGGGRSVAPRRDEEVDTDQTVAGDTVTPNLGPTEPERAQRGSGNPLDL